MQKGHVSPHGRNAEEVSAARVDEYPRVVPHCRDLGNVARPDAHLDHEVNIRQVELLEQPEVKPIVPTVVYDGLS